MEAKHFDSLIFDMDGTLWDAVDSYCKVWDATIKQCGVSRAPLTRHELVGLMGQSIGYIMTALLPGLNDHDGFLRQLECNEDSMMPQLGGCLYPGVKETIPELARHCRLFIVSNCSAYGLPNFLKYTGMEPYFTGTLSYGETLCPKETNIAKVVEQYGLKSPLYVGDTQGDADSCRKAGLPIAWAAYGFGHIGDPDFTLERFSDLYTKILGHER